MFLLLEQCVCFFFWGGGGELGVWLGFLMINEYGWSAYIIEHIFLICILFASGD